MDGSGAHVPVALEAAFGEARGLELRRRLEVDPSLGHDAGERRLERELEQTGVERGIQQDEVEGRGGAPHRALRRPAARN